MKDYTCPIMFYVIMNIDPHSLDIIHLWEMFVVVVAIFTLEVACVPNINKLIVVNACI